MIRLLVVILLFSLPTVAQVQGTAQLTVQQPGSFLPADLYFNNFDYPEMRANLNFNYAPPISESVRNALGLPSGVRTGCSTLRGLTIGEFGSECVGGTGGCARVIWADNGGMGESSCWPHVPTNAYPGREAYGQAFYTRAKYKFTPGFQVKNGVSVCSGKVQYWRDYTPPSEDATLSFQNIGPTDNGDYFEFHLTIGESFQQWAHVDCNIASCRIPKDGQFHSVESFLDRPNKRWMVWIDGVLKADLNPIPLLTIPESSTHITSHGIYWNDNDPPGPDCLSDGGGTMWIDDIAISTTRIGP